MLQAKERLATQVGKTSDSIPAADFHAMQGTRDRYLQKTVLKVWAKISYPKIVEAACVD